MRALDARPGGGLSTGVAAALLILATQGCAPSTPRPTEGSRDFRVRLHRFTHENGGTRYVSLEPLRVGPAPSITADEVVLSVGALYAHGRGGDTGGPYHALALVLRTTSRGGGAILAADRSLLLWMDGAYLASNPVGGGHVYRVAESSRGVEETLMVPLGPDEMRALAEAGEVRGRLGPWFSFVLPRAHRRALLALLDAIPPDVEYNRAEPVGRIVADRQLPPSSVTDRSSSARRTISRTSASSRRAS